MARVKYEATLAVRMSQQEHARLVAVANRLGVKLSEYARRVLAEAVSVQQRREE